MICFLCGNELRDGRAVSLNVDVSHLGYEYDDKPTQTFFCHEACFSEVVNKAITFDAEALKI